MSDEEEKDEPVNASLDDDEASDEEEEGGSKKKLILFIAVPLLALAGIGAGLYFTGMLDGLLGKSSSHKEASADEHGDEHGGDEYDDKKADSHGDEHGDSHGEDHAKGEGGTFLAIPDMVVNLSTSDGTSRYLRLSVQLELNSVSDMRKIEAILPRVVDQFQTYLRELRVKDLRGSAGIYRLQIELLSRVNAAAYPVKVKDVLFQEILIQ